MMTVRNEDYVNGRQEENDKERECGCQKGSMARVDHGAAPKKEGGCVRVERAIKISST